MATLEEQYAQRQAENQATYDKRQAENQSIYDQRQAQAQQTYDQRQAEAQKTYDTRLAESSGKIEDLYGKAFEAQKQQINTALDKGVQAQEEARAGIAKTFQTSANDLATQYERNRRNLNAQALARGLNTGTGSQQQLALNQGYMSSYGKLRGEESTQNAGIDRAIANLKTDAQNQITQALADNDYKKAAALMDDYNNKLNWFDTQSMNNRSYLDTQSMNNQNYIDTALQNNRGRLDTVTDRNQNWFDSMTMDKAQTLASYGDFSGYSALGYDQNTINNMKNMWAAQNPLLAYNTGAISADKYYSMTGEYPPGYTPPAAESSGGGSGGGGGSYNTGSGKTWAEEHAESLWNTQATKTSAANNLKNVISAAVGKSVVAEPNKR